VREIRTLRSTWRGLETWRGRNSSASTGAPVLDPTLELQPGVTIARYEALYGTVFLLQIHAVYMEGLRKAGLPEG
jgi:hypothetical protein